MINVEVLGLKELRVLDLLHQLNQQPQELHAVIKPVSKELLPLLLEELMGQI